MNPTRLRDMVGRWLTASATSCTIRTPGAAPVWDPDTGFDDPQGEIVYQDKCLIRPTGGERTVIAGETTVTLRTYDLTLYWTSIGFERDQLVTIDASDDPYMVGRILRVEDVQGGSGNPHRRLVVEDTLDRSPIEEGS